MCDPLQPKEHMLPSHFPLFAPRRVLPIGRLRLPCLWSGRGRVWVNVQQQ